MLEQVKRKIVIKMMSLSQQNLLKLAEENEDKGQWQAAIDNLEEGLRNGHALELVVALSAAFRHHKEEDQAYDLLKEEPDLFSDPSLFNEYCQVLKANHFLIEALQVQNLSQKSLPLTVTPVSERKQQQIMNSFKGLKQISQNDYERLFKLSLPHFSAFAQSLLLDPSQNFAVRLSLCEDLVRLGLKETFSVFVLDKKESFVPAQEEILANTAIYKETIAAIGGKFQHNPSQLPLMLGETNLVLGSLYPKLSTYVDDPDSFASDLVSYLTSKKGHSHQELFTRIYQYLPK